MVANDGFEIAEVDMKLRGPGDIEGTQQSGIGFDLKIANLGKDGESYLVGRDNLFRSNSSKFEISTIANPAFVVDNELIGRIIEGKQGNQATMNYLGEYVLSSYAQIDITGIKYALMVEMSITEVTSPKVTGKEKDYLAHAAALYGFPDLYLIGPDV